MGLHKNQGTPSAALAEECGEVIQVIAKMFRFGGSWDEIPPGKDKTRWEQLEAEMADVIYQWERLKSIQAAIHELPEPLDESFKSLE